jgi:hypothetical protein
MSLHFGRLPPLGLYVGVIGPMTASWLGKFYRPARLQACFSATGAAI